MKTTLIKNATLVNEGRIFVADVLIEGKFISKISEQGINADADKIIDAKGLHLLPGLIDDQVHFREPGLTHKGEIYTEAKAAVAGGITSYMEMPNTNPQTLTQQLLEEKYARASQCSLANYSFFMGASNTNLEEVLKTNPKNVCGIKVFMGSSTGNMLVDKTEILEQLFANAPTLIATHCEDEATIQTNLAEAIKKFGDNIPVEQHPVIRSAEACYKSSSIAVELAKKHNARLHVLHISSKEEVALFESNVPLKDKRITAEACVHHLWFSDADYKTKGVFIKWNPAVKSANDRDAVLAGVLNNNIDVIATDHAPHTLEEKAAPYLKCPSGGPLVQHSLIALLEMHRQQKISLETIVQKTSHNLAILFEIDRRGYIREGYFADMVLVDLTKPETVTKSNILYKCGWSPFEGTTFNSSVTHTFVSGHLAYQKGVFDESKLGERLLFNR